MTSRLARDTYLRAYVFVAWPNRINRAVIVKDMEMSAAADSASVVCMGDLINSRVVGVDALRREKFAYSHSPSGGGGSCINSMSPSVT